MRWVVIAIFIVSAVYVHFRGRVRMSPWKQIADHSSLLAPLNCFAYMFSRVPTTPYLELANFPELAPIRNSWQIIRDEAIALRDDSRIKASSKLDDLGFNSFFKTGWKRFYLKWYGAAHPSAIQRCPRTTAILSQIPSVKAAMFAELPPGSRLVRHRDPFAGSLRYHLGLETPNSSDCHIEVDGKSYYWRDGEAVMFDETYIHFAENKTEQDRIILFCDIERPMRFAWAQAFVHAVGSVLLRAAASPNETGDATGGFNRVFGFIYQLRIFGKRMKKWNRPVYYLVKWVVFGGIAALILWLI